MAVFACIGSVGTETHYAQNIAKFWHKRLSTRLPTFLVCGCSSEDHTKLIHTVLIRQLAKIYVANLTGVINESEAKLLKLQTRPMSKKIKKL